MVDIQDIKELRERTGLPIAKCKEALEESGGDSDKAYEILREKGSVAARKKAGRDFGSGSIQSYIHTTNQIGAMVELLCETDFVARNGEFLKIARDIAMHCAAFRPEYRSRDDIPNDVIDQVTGELRERVDKEKPEETRKKILEGMLDTELGSVILLEQKFVRDEKRTIRDIVEEATQKFGERIEIGRFEVWVI